MDSGRGGVFVAREAELGRLDAALGAATSGLGQALFVAGEAGSGKTSLVLEFMRRAEARHADLLFAFADCNARTGAGDPYLPFREILALLTGDTASELAQGNITAENATRLERFRRLAQEALLQAGGDLIGMFIPGGSMLTWIAGKIVGVDRRLAGPGNPARILEQYTNVIRAAADHQPLALVIDDLQWADAASVELLFHMVRRLEGSRVLVIGTYRPAEVALGRDGRRHPLEPVLNEIRRYSGDVVMEVAASESDRRDFVARIVASEPNRLDDRFQDQLLAHTGGHALFVVELLRVLEERGDIGRAADGAWVQTGAIDWSLIPPRVEGVIEERIGRVDQDLRDALTVACVEGEVFNAEVVARVRGLEERGLVRRLSEELDRRHRLVTAQGTRRVAGGRLSSYRFGHALIQRYLYDRLDASERAYLHQDIGEALEELLGDGRQDSAVLLASHFVESGDDARAVDYLRLAAGQSVRLAAYTEALAHVRQGVEIVERMPPGPERDRRELLLLAAASAPLLATRGFADAEVQSVHGRAHELAQALGDEDELLPILFGLLTFHLGRGDIAAAHEVAQRRLDLARQRGDVAFEVEALSSIGMVTFYKGQLEAARAHIEQALSLQAAADASDAATVRVFEPAVSCRRSSALVYWLLGRTDDAEARMREAVEMAIERAVPYNVVAARCFAAVLAQWRGDAGAAADHAREGRALAETGGFRFWISFAAILETWAGARLALAAGDAAAAKVGAPEMERVIDAFAAAGTELWRPYFLYLLADVRAGLGRDDEALAALAAARATSARTGEVFWDPEILRLEAELLDAVDPAEAGARRRQAMALAERQGSAALLRRI